MEKLLKYIDNNKKEILIITTITILAIILRAIALYNRSGVWLDELFSIYFIRQDNVLDVIKTLYNEDVHSPLYFVLIHLICKIFPDTIFSYKLFSTLISTLAIPIGYFFAKNIFNKETGYFFATLLATNIFYIYYTVEIRFYGILVLASILATYFQFKVLQNEQHKAGLILSNLFVIYTFNIGILFIFFQYLVGLLYLLLAKKRTFEYIKTGVITVIFSIPIIIFLIKTSVTYNNSLFSFAKDVFYFDISFIYSVLQAYFSNFFYTNLQNQTLLYNLLTFVNPKAIFFGIIPIIISLFALTKGAKSKDNRFYLILLPSLIFLITEIILASLGKMGIICRHTIIAYPAIILALSFSFNSIKKVNIKIGLFTLLILINLSTIIFLNNLIQIKFTTNERLKTDISSLHLGQNDYILNPEWGLIYKPFLESKSNYIDLSINNFCFYNNNLKPVIFDEEISQIINKENKSDILKPYLTTTKPLKNYQKYLKNNYLKNIKKDERVCLIIFSPKLKFVQPSQINEFRYKHALYESFINKINLETVKALSENFTLQQTITGKNNDYIIFLFKK